MAIFRFGQLGDTLVAMPAIDAVRRRFPTHRLYLITTSNDASTGAWNVLQPTGWFDGALFYDSTLTLPFRLLSALRLANALRRLNPEFVIDLSPKRTQRQKSRDRFFFKHLAGGAKHLWPSDFVGSPRKADGNLPRVIPEWQRLLSAVGAAPPERFRLGVSKEAASSAANYLRPLKGAAYIVMAPGSNRQTTQWPLERFAALGTLLMTAMQDIQIVIVGGPKEIALGDSLVQQWGGRGLNLAGKISVYETAAAMSNAIAYVGNDSGPMHLAAMVGTPCVAVFSARNYPGEWDPYGSGHIVIRHETSCSGCALDVCVLNRLACLLSISVPEVFQAVAEIVSKHRNNSA